MRPSSTGPILPDSQQHHHQPLSSWASSYLDGLLDGVIGGLKRTQRRLRSVAPRSPHPRKVADILKDTEDLVAKLEAMRADGAGRESEAN